jgi:hypothetical protein
VARSRARRSAEVRRRGVDAERRRGALEGWLRVRCPWRRGMARGDPNKEPPGEHVRNAGCVVPPRRRQSCRRQQEAPCAAPPGGQSAMLVQSTDGRDTRAVFILLVSLRPPPLVQKWNKPLHRTPRQAALRVLVWSDAERPSAVIQHHLRYARLLREHTCMGYDGVGGCRSYTARLCIVPLPAVCPSRTPRDSLVRLAGRRRRCSSSATARPTAVFMPRQTRALRDAGGASGVK